MISARSVVYFWLILLFFCAGVSKAVEMKSVNGLSVAVSGVSKLDGKVQLEKVEVRSADGLPANFVHNINLELRSAFVAFQRAANECGRDADGGLWSYESKFEKIAASKGYLSFIFSTFSSCGGSPDVEKKAVVFSTLSGEKVSPQALFKIFFPSARIPSRQYGHDDLVGLEESLADALIESGEKGVNDIEAKCEFYLRNGSYRLWPDQGRIVVFPEFIQPQSSCQKEYILPFD